MKKYGTWYGPKPSLASRFEHFVLFLMSLAPCGCVVLMWILGLAVVVGLIAFTVHLINSGFTF